MSNKSALNANNISVKFGGLVAVDDVSFDIPENSVISLIGPNGAGKTTFFNVLTGLYKPTSGTVTFDGKDITDLVPNDRPVNTVFQNYALFPHMTVHRAI